MFALWMAVTFFRPWRSASSKAYREILEQAFSVTIFRLSTIPGAIRCSSP